MNYSFMTFSTPALTFDQALKVAKQYGYDGIEPRLDAKHAHGVEVSSTADQRRQFVQQARTANIRIACLATSLTYADPAKRTDMLKQTHERIDLAGDLGVPAMRVFGGGIPKGIPREQAIDGVADALREAAAHAQERRVTLCMETHDDWCDPKHVKAVMERVNHPAVAVNWDIMHPVRTGLATIDESFLALKPWIRHLHVHDAKQGTELVPIGQGKIDHRRAIELLLGIRFDGFISGEWIGWEPYDAHLPRELATLRTYEQEIRNAER
jgi:sugar phosphate isomerase/epimerase